MLKQIVKIIVFPSIFYCGALLGVEEASLGEKRDVEVLSSVNYFSIGGGPLPLPVPYFGLGHREQYHHHGWDVSLKAATIVYATQVKWDVLYLYYFKPDLKSQFYVGAEMGMGGLFGHRHSFKNLKFFYSPEFIVGKQYTNEANDSRFIQAEISWPTCTERYTLYMPLVVISYGICF